MSNTHDEDRDFGISNTRNHSIVAHPIFPGVSELGALQRLADAARVFQLRKALVQELEYPAVNLRI